MYFFKFKIPLIILLFVFLGVTIKAQERGAPVILGGMGSASSYKQITKVIQLIDAETNEKLSGMVFSLNKSGAIVISGRSDLNGYTVLRFSISNYYRRLSLKISGQRLQDTSKKVISESNFLPLDDRIIFLSNRTYIDTLVVKLKRVDGTKK